MNESLRLQRFWKALCFVARVPIEKLFAFSHENHALDAPSLVVANHVTNYDPLFLAISFPKSQMYFVASEHLFRKGWISWIISYLAAPIARRKGSSGFDAAMTCLRKIRSGHSVALFAEGETTWDGCSRPIFPATAMLARASGGSLVTYRLEGGYLTAPRWGKGIRRGWMHGGIVNVYTAQQLKAMSEAEVKDAINHDLYEDAYERQKQQPVRYRSKRPAEHIEAALYMCPACRHIGGLTGKGDKVRCSCGFERRYTEYGAFEPIAPFATVREWDEWQHAQLLSGAFEHGEELFGDEKLELFEIMQGHRAHSIASGRLSADEHALYFAGKRYAYADIPELALVQCRKMLFTYQEKYYELCAEGPVSLRKYLAVWQAAVNAQRQ